MWFLIIVLFVICVEDFATWSQGIDTYPMFILFGLILVYLLIKSSSNRQLYWSIIFVSVSYFLTEIFNFLYFPFFPVKSYFGEYFIIFFSFLVASLICIYKCSIKWNYSLNNFLQVLVMVVLAIVAGYVKHNYT